MKDFETIIWDWNGTLLDDVDVCIESINSMLSVRGHNALDRAAYRDIFTFPVRDYYELAGFDFSKERFDVVAIEFIDLYREKVRQCGVFPHARPALDWFAGKGYSQYVISAMEHRFLMETLRQCGIDHYFEDFSGVRDHLANGKATMAADFIQKRGIIPEKTLFIGDTLHDFEVADGLGMNCLLVAEGHQSEVRLKESGCEVVGSLSQVMKRMNQ